MAKSLSDLLESLTSSVAAAAQVVPEDIDTPTENGISLFDVKNELLLSYLQNLVFIIILKLRSLATNQSEGSANDDLSVLNDEAVKKLVELRLYLEKGVKPLEARLKYQIDKVIRASDDAVRATKPKPPGSHMHVNKQRRRQIEGADDFSSDANEADGAGTSGSEADMDELALRPNPAGLLKAAAQSQHAAAESRADDDGIYRPPRINPVAMPTTERKEARDRRPEKSAILNEFITDEYSTAPAMEASIGSTITAGGRRTKSHREREEEAEKQSYEESNFMRLPKQGKQERANKNARSASSFGGEDWKDLNRGMDRIQRLTRRSNGDGGSLARSKKRLLDVADRPTGSGERIGTGFQKRRKTLGG